ncbi:MAG: hypothetical protein DRJ14_05545 [Acidobacteria bacterium]|nr:MAG: hypothetical protein DRJ14_05545 [Acidobacteriota bacterium]
MSGTKTSNGSGEMGTVSRACTGWTGFSPPIRVRRIGKESLPVPVEDVACIKAVLAGDKETFSKIVERYRKRAFLTAYGIVHNEQDAWDLSQEAFIRAYRNLKKFDLSRPFYPWFYRILKNRCLSFLRKRKQMAEVSIEGVFGLKTSEIDHDQARLVQECVAALPENAREIVNLRYYQGYSYQEIADILEKPIGSVMSGLFYARKKLKELLQEKGL